MNQFRNLQRRQKQVNPETPPSFDRNTDRLLKEEYFRKMTASLDDTAEQTAISAPKRTRFIRNGLEDAPHLLVYGGICDHIEQRTDKIPPKEIYVSYENYLKIVAHILSQSSEGFTGKYMFPAYDGTNSIPIGLGHDELPGVNELIPANTVICIH